jgi:hypothetical protein
MKVIILTESQVDRLISEQILLPGIFSGSDVQKTAIKATAKYLNMDPHTRNAILSIGAYFIPYVGPALSTGIQAYDASLYLKEGKNKEAGLTLFLMCLPLIGSVVQKIPGVKQLGTKGMSLLSKKIISNGALSPLENSVVSSIKSNTKLIDIAKQQINSRLANSGYDAIAGAKK